MICDWQEKLAIVLALILHTRYSNGKIIFIIDITIIVDGFEIDKQMKNGVLGETLSNNTI